MESVSFRRVVVLVINRVLAARWMLLANPKMSDKLQFVGAFGNRRMAETSDKLKFVGH